MADRFTLAFDSEKMTKLLEDWQQNHKDSHLRFYRTGDNRIVAATDEIPDQKNADDQKDIVKGERYHCMAVSELASLPAEQNEFMINFLSTQRQTPEEFDDFLDNTGIVFAGKLGL